MSSKGAFTPAPEDIKIAKDLAFVSTIPGTFISFLVLLAYSALACFKQTRTSLNRVSFRLMVYTLVFNVLFGIAYTATPSYPGSLCNFSAFAVNFTLSFATFFTTCIAVNLQLVLVHGINGKRMEKFYIIVTAVLSIALNVPTYVLHEFGFNQETGTCWYSNPDPKVRLKWTIGTQSFWITLAATVETVCSCVVLVWLYHAQRVIVTIMRNVPQKERRLEQQPGVPLSRVDKEHRSTLIVLNKRYRRVILRIVMYPVVSLIINYSTVILDLNMTIHKLRSQYDYNLLILDLIMYGIRPLAYGILAALDPAFTKAFRIIRVRESKHNRNLKDEYRRHEMRTRISFAVVSGVQNTVSLHASDSVDGLAVGNEVEVYLKARTEQVEHEGERPDDEELIIFESQL